MHDQPYILTPLRLSMVVSGTGVYMDIRESCLIRTSGDGKSCKDGRRMVDADKLVGLLDGILDGAKVSCAIVRGEEEDSLGGLGIRFSPPAPNADGGSDRTSFWRFNKTAGVRGL